MTAEGQTANTVSVEYPPALTGGLPIAVTWEGWWANGIVREGDRTLGTLPDETAFLRGATFVLSDGREFAFRLARGWNGQRYVATIDGRPIDGGDDVAPETRAGYVLWVVGLLSLTGFQTSGWTAVVVAVGLMALGVLAIRKVRWAAIAGALWVTANALFAWYACFKADGSVFIALVGSALAFALVRWAFLARTRR